MRLCVTDQTYVYACMCVGRAHVNVYKSQSVYMWCVVVCLCLCLCFCLCCFSFCFSLWHTCFTEITAASLKSSLFELTAKSRRAASKFQLHVCKSYVVWVMSCSLILYVFVCMLSLFQTTMLLINLAVGSKSILFKLTARSRRDDNKLWLKGSTLFLYFSLSFCFCFMCLLSLFLF